MCTHMCMMCKMDSRLLRCWLLGQTGLPHACRQHISTTALNLVHRCPSAFLTGQAPGIMTWLPRSKAGIRWHGCIRMPHLSSPMQAVLGQCIEPRKVVCNAAAQTLSLLVCGQLKMNSRISKQTSLKNLGQNHTGSNQPLKSDNRFRSIRTFFLRVDCITRAFLLPSALVHRCCKL